MSEPRGARWLGLIVGPGFCRCPIAQTSRGSFPSTMLHEHELVSGGDDCFVYHSLMSRSPFRPSRAPRREVERRWLILCQCAQRGQRGVAQPESWRGRRRSGAGAVCVVSVSCGLTWPIRKQPLSNDFLVGGRPGESWAPPVCRFKQTSAMDANGGKLD